MLFIQHNLLAENANRQLKISTGKNTKTTEKLSSGYKINRAADDAAGLSISEKMRRQVRGLHQTVDNISEGVGYVQTAEGALNEVHDMLQRINELAVKAANGTNTVEDRAYIDSEIQHLKNEMNRIFSETTFNERKIWEPGDQKLLGYRPVRAVSPSGPANSMSITNKNYEVLPGGGYYSSSSSGYFLVNADVDKGVKISWYGYNGTHYETKEVDWDTLKEQKYSFEMSDYFDKDKYPELFDGDKPVFEHQVEFSPAETATVQDMADSLNQTWMEVYSHVSMNPSWENTTGNNANFSFSSYYLYCPAAYLSQKNAGTAGNGHNYDAADDIFLEPAKSGNTNLTTCPQYNGVDAARNDSTNWEFSFEMTGIGKVKGTSTSISYVSNDLTEEHEGLWWYWCIHKEHGVETYRHQASYTKSASGTLAGLMSALTGDENEQTPGLLNKDNKGCNAGTGGTISLHFQLTAEKGIEFTDYNGNTHNEPSVGAFTLSIPVSATETEQAVYEKVTKALNEHSVLDFSTSGAGADGVTFYPLNPSYKSIQAPIYGGICSFYVQAGTEGGQHISVQYEALSTLALGIGNTNVLTQESASRAIDEVKGALQMVSEQRSTFGAYQNRIEHARNINANVEENTQAAESRIRDSDIADLMMEYSINNILMQAGTSMLTQANQGSQSILELLQ